MAFWGKNKCCTTMNAHKYGSFKRKSDGELIQRFLCKKCKSTFSVATNDLAFGQKKRFINDVCQKMLTDNISIRKCAKILNVSTTTILRKSAFFKKQGLI
jgi:transposase-like protein